MESNNKNSEKMNKESNKWASSPKDIILMSIFTLSFIVQIILLFVYNNELSMKLLEYVGYGLWVVSIIFGIAPIIILKRKGKAPKGKSYIHTQKIVTDGLYALVRHPQYLAGIFFSLSISFITQSWISFILTGLIILLTYQWTYQEDKELIKRFGDKYSQYKQKVPRLNILLGIAYYLLRGRKNQKKTQ